MKTEERYIVALFHYLQTGDSMLNTVKE